MSLQSIRRNTSTLSCRPSVLQLNVWANQFVDRAAAFVAVPRSFGSPPSSTSFRPFNSRHQSGRGAYCTNCSLQLKPCLSDAARSEAHCKTTRRPRCGNDRCIDILRMRRRTSSGDLTDKYGKGRSKRGTRCRSIIIGLLMIVGGTVLGGFACSRRKEPDTWRSVNFTVRAGNERCISRPACGEITAKLCHPDAIANRQGCCLHPCGASAGYSMHGHRPCFDLICPNVCHCRITSRIGGRQAESPAQRRSSQVCRMPGRSMLQALQWRSLHAARLRH